MHHRPPTEPSGSFAEKLVGFARLHRSSAFGGEGGEKIQLSVSSPFASLIELEHTEKKV